MPNTFFDLIFRGQVLGTIFISWRYVAFKITPHPLTDQYNRFILQGLVGALSKIVCQS